MKINSKTRGLFALLLCGQVAASGAVGDNKEIISPKSVLVFDVWNYFESAGITDSQYRADIIYMLTSLQGIVNREQPRLYLLTALSLFDLESKYNADPDRSTRPVTELDAWWLEWFQEKGWVDPDSIERLNTLEEVVAYFKDDIKGLARWDVSVGATINAAFMAAGAEDFLPVSDALAGGKLIAWFEKEFPDIKVELDMSGVF